jgi:hypothetical protein
MRDGVFQFGMDVGSPEIMLRDDIDKLLKCELSGGPYDEKTQNCLNSIYAALNRQCDGGADISSLRCDIIRLGNIIGLDFTRILGLVLKAQFEQLITDDAPGQVDMNLVLPDEVIKEIYQAFEQTYGIDKKAGCSFQEFESLVQEMVLAGLHKVANDSPEHKAFKSRGDATTVMLQAGTPEQQDAYWILKTQWLHLQDEVGNCLTMLERRRLENATIKRNFLAEFGREYLEMQGQLNHLEGLGLRRNLLRADPDLSAEELEHLVLDAEQGRQRALEKLRLELAFSTIIFHSNDSTSMSEDGYQRFKKKYKQLLRKVWLTIHPDQLQNNPEYRSLTRHQQDYLKLLWEELMEIRPEETGYQKEQIGYTFRDMDRLAEIAQLADTILANAGIDTSASMIIQGNTLEEQLNWLKERNRYLEQQIDLIKIELRVLLEDRDMREKMAMLACSAGQKNRIITEMLARSKNYHEEADQIQAELESIMSQGA